MRNRYILVLRNKDNWEDKFSIILTPLNTILIFCGVFVIFTLFILLLLLKTPLKEYLIPGGNDGKLRREYLKINVLKDSLEYKMKVLDQERENLKKILLGADSIYHYVPKGDSSQTQIDQSENKANNEEIAFRKEMEKIGITNYDGIPTKLGYNFFPPVQGYISDSFNIQNKHYALDIVSKKNSNIKSIKNGTVILSTWSPDYGHFLIIQHSDNLISVYKHNAANLKQEGQAVSGGEPIALLGGTGEMSSGPHLHFEMWQQGTPVNPKEYILF